MKTTVAVIGIAATLTGLTACSSDPAPIAAPEPIAAAPAAGPSRVDCHPDDGKSTEEEEFTHVLFHKRDDDGQPLKLCIANTGEFELPASSVVDEIRTGRNLVRYESARVIEPKGAPLSRHFKRQFDSGGLEIQTIHMNP